MKATPVKKAKSAETTETKLAQLLADSYALLGQTQYEELFLAIDELAERLRALDVIAPGGLKTLASLSSIKELPVKPHHAKDFVAHLLEGHEILNETAKKLRDLAEKSGDAETQDLAIKRIQIHDKTIWMFRAFLKNP